MGTTVYDDAAWRPVAPDAPYAHLHNALSSLQKPHHQAWALHYNHPASLNGLMSWTRYTDPWPLAALTLRYGLGRDEASQPMEFREISAALNRKEQIIRNALGASAEYSLSTHLVAAHRLLLRAPQDALELNQLRAMGLDVATWYPLAFYGGIFTSEQLRACSQDDLSAIRGINTRKQKIITQVLQRGYR